MKTGNLRAVQWLLVLTNMNSAVRYLGVELARGFWWTPRNATNNAWIFAGVSSMSPSWTRVLIIAFAATEAAAETCPSREDLHSSGVTVEFADGASFKYSSPRDDPQRVLEVVDVPPPDAGYWSESWRGVYQMKQGPLNGGAPDRRFFIQSVYPDDQLSLPEPRVGVSWRGVVRTVDSLGAEIDETTLQITFEGARTVVIGSCVYEAVQVEALFLEGDGGYRSTFDYLPALGISVQTASGRLSDLMDFYRATSIRVSDGE